MESVYEVPPTSLWDSMARFRAHLLVFLAICIILICANANTEYWLRSIWKPIFNPRHIHITLRPHQLQTKGMGSSQVGSYESRRRTKHVYLRVCWFYSPNKLPHGRERYHGKRELVASDSMSMIDASSVRGHADAVQWIESREDPLPGYPRLCWRQAYNVSMQKFCVSDFSPTSLFFYQSL